MVNWDLFHWFFFLVFFFRENIFSSPMCETEWKRKFWFEVPWRNVLLVLYWTCATGELQPLVVKIDIPKTSTWKTALRLKTIKQDTNKCNYRKYVLQFFFSCQNKKSNAPGGKLYIYIFKFHTWKYFYLLQMFVLKKIKKPRKIILAKLFFFLTI